jgi:hypothetical protein
VRQDDRQRPFALAALVDEVHANAVDVGAEVGEAIDRLFLLAPIKARQPVPDQVSQVRTIRPVIPALVFDFVRPSRALEAVPQIIERLLRHPYLERFDTHQYTSAETTPSPLAHCMHVAVSPLPEQSGNRCDQVNKPNRNELFRIELVYGC